LPFWQLSQLLTHFANDDGIGTSEVLASVVGAGKGEADMNGLSALGQDPCGV
jgi:hypothetical protein